MTVPPRIAVTMGDPAGIGPEVCLKLAARAETLEICTPIIFGDAGVLARVARHCSLPMPPRIVARDHWQQAWRELREPAVLDLGMIDADSVQPGVVDAVTGEASYRYIEAAIVAALAGEVGAIVTAPVHKEALRWAGIPYPGHTEMLAAKTKAERACMMLTCSELTCSFVTTHVGYRDVPGLLSVERILDVIQLSRDAMRRLRGREPKLVICGLNPHAGEHGLFGDREEERIIKPAADAARALGIAIEGPLPPDTAFLRERRGETDCFVCMYHDQGHILLKALAFEMAVNVTLGLPIIRTSVDHGTACDIAWQGKADVSSMVQAAKLAAKLATPC
jgi:4-hydroxythreonine-4-phosphate dehydrogenase